MRLLCPACGNTAAAKTCTTCKGHGRVPLTQCPQRYVGGEIWDAVSLARLAEKGLGMPVAGGLIEQADAWLTFYDVWTEALARAKAEGQ